MQPPPEPLPLPKLTGVGGAIAETNWDAVSAYADWTAASGGLLAVIVAAFAAWATIRTNRAQQETLELQRQQLELQRQDRQSDAEDKRRSQAIKVVFWGESGTAKEERHLKLFILNRSDAQITVRGIAYKCSRQTADGNGMESVVVQAAIYDTVPPSEDRPLGLSTRISSDRPIAASLHYLVFQDAAGLTWYRYTVGGLSEKNDPNDVYVESSYNGFDGIDLTIRRSSIQGPHVW